MGQWSGLAPAYNTHMQRWAKVDTDMRYLQDLEARATDNTVAIPNISSWYHRPLYGWFMFARTWGLPRDDGRVDPGLGKIDTETGTMYGINDESTIQGREQFDMRDHMINTGVGMLRQEHGLLDRSTTFYVSGSVVEYVTQAAELAEPEPLFPTDLQAMHGFCVLEHPVMLPDLNPDTGEIDPRLRVAIRAFGWSAIDNILHGPADDRQVGPGVMTFLYSTPDDLANYYARDLKRLYGRDSDVFMDGVAHDSLYPSDVLPWAFGVPWNVRDSAVHEAGSVISTVGYWRRWFMTLCRFMWQTIVVPERPGLSKKVTKRWMVEAKRRPLNDVAVLRLRRVRDDQWTRGETGTGMPLDHAVKVRGHWRRQHHRSLGPARLDDGTWNENSHRLVWIEEHIRGEGPIGALHSATIVTR